VDAITNIKITESSGISGTQYENNRELDKNSEQKAQELPVNDNIRFEKAFNKAKQYVEINNTRLSLSYDEENKEPVIYVMDRETDEVIRRIPPEKLVEISGDQEKMKGLFFQKDV